MDTAPPKTPLWYEGSMELDLSTVSGNCVTFGNREKSFDSVEFSKQSWLALGAPTTIFVAISRARG